MSVPLCCVNPRCPAEARTAVLGTKRGPVLVIPPGTAIRWDAASRCWWVRCEQCRQERSWRGQVAREVVYAA